MKKLILACLILQTLMLNCKKITVDIDLTSGYEQLDIELADKLVGVWHSDSVKYCGVINTKEVIFTFRSDNTGELIEIDTMHNYTPSNHISKTQISWSINQQILRYKDSEFEHGITGREEIKITNSTLFLKDIKLLYGDCHQYFLKKQ